MYKAKGDIPREEVIKMLEEAKINQKHYFISKEEWQTKLILDLIILIVFALFIVKKIFVKNVPCEG